MYDARAVANAMLGFAEAEGLRLTNLKLQKLLYLAHGYSLVREGRPLVKGGFEAWAYGPVSRTAYNAFKKYDDLPITERARRFDPVMQQHFEIDVEIEQPAVFIIEEVVRYYGSWHEFDLVEFTHRPWSPWDSTVKSAEITTNVGMVIDEELIRTKFEGPVELDRQDDEIEGGKAA
jgi:uncharacterized phage-associated protein